MSGRVTMRGLSRWAGKGGSYRTIQRSFNTSLSWGQLQWLLIRQHLLDADEVVVMSGDYVVVTKAGKMTYGLDRFFSSLVWQGGARAVFSEFIPAQCQAPYVLPGGDRTSGEDLRGSRSSPVNEEVQGATGTSPREQESQPSGGGTQPIAPFYPRAHQEPVEADWCRCQGHVLYF
jgi:DDE superfamily endonuclease